MLVLKEYQERALTSLRAYFRRCSEAGDADTAFYATTRETFGTGIPYRPVPALPGLPYVCIRIPTGGGKTLVACHSVQIAASELLQTDAPVVVWLVPSNTIQQQTLGALKDRSHPYRQALDSGLESLTVVDVEQALSLSRPQLDSGGTIIVSTLQSFRVEDTLGRRVYRDSGQLMDHFTGLAEETTRPLEHGDHGNLLHSLANVLRLRRPLVIVDEAHNARTHLSFDTLQRLDPSCIVEFTATPDTGKNASNVLHSASARELKAEAMIKMPIRLETRPDWKALLSDAVSCRDMLESIAASEQQETGEYLRPIVLIQAQPHRKKKETVTVETVQECLITEFGIPSEQVAVATGSQRDLEGIDVLSPATPVRYIITMQALREGWDCPFAYVLCTVAEIASPTYVEQILGRIMRLPKAAWKNHQELNVAYAFAASRRFLDAANALTDALVQNGFERQEAEDLIVQAPGEEVGTLFPASDVIPERGEAAETPSDRRQVFSVPVLAVRQGSLLEPLEETHFLDHAWNLAKCDASFSPEEYSPGTRRAQVGEIDITREGRLQSRFIDQLQEDTHLFADDEGWSLTDLVLWLDRGIPHPDIGAEQSAAFLRSLVDQLVEARHIAVAELAKDRYRLRKSAAAKIERHRFEAHSRACERLFADDCVTPVVVSPECCFTYPPDQYPASTLDTRAYAWQKHYYPKVGLLDSQEEFECAQHIDQREAVDFWVRNLANRATQSFSIQTSTDRFYPDFVCKLKDGRYLVVEYKGKHLYSTDDSKEKRDLGGLWEKRSGGRCLFIMVTQGDYEAIDGKVGGGRWRSH